jgi:hypothetical protein
MCNRNHPTVAASEIAVMLAALVIYFSKNKNIWIDDNISDMTIREIQFFPKSDKDTGNDANSKRGKLYSGRNFFCQLWTY